MNLIKNNDKYQIWFHYFILSKPEGEKIRERS